LDALHKLQLKLNKVGQQRVIVLYPCRDCTISLRIIKIGIY
jgi:hypothetical protein